MKALVVGGGIFGVCAAIELSKNGIETNLLEKNDKLMQEATSVNQNRFHLGYHYPRSVATAKQCLQGVSSFKEYFGSVLVNPKENYYAIGKDGSRVSFSQYLQFCKNLGLQYQEKLPGSEILNPTGISGCIKVSEPVMNLARFKTKAEGLLKKSGAKIYLKRKFEESDASGYDIVVNATYSNLNNVNKILDLPRREFRYDLCNVPVLSLPKELSGIGITIMDGEFYSILPYGDTPYHLFWSVKGSALRSISTYPPARSSKKIADYNNGRFVPLLKKAKLVDVLRVTKVLRPDVELSDERVTDLIDYGGGKFAILSAKINTCVLTARKLVKLINAQNKNKRK